MRSLQFDFQRKRSPSVSGWLVLAAGLAALGGLAQVQYEFSQQQEAQAVRFARLHTPAATLAGNEPDEPAVVAARQLLDRSKLPWNNLFTALESVDTTDVALLAITPDVQRRQIKIHAEARDLAAMLAFQRQLQQNAALSQVVLLDHTVMKDVPEKPVRFHLLAHWGVAHVSP
jgi:hypothetical protein